MSKQQKKAEPSGQLDLSTRSRIDELAARIDRYRASYYAGTPEISDAAYDALEDELRDIDPTHPVLAHVGTPVTVTEWEKARHEIPMGSLNKVVNEGELEAWAARCDELSVKEGGKPISDNLSVAEKLDGISIEVIYRDGRFADAITRGDGVIGERISANVARMRGVPQKLREKHTLSIRGEIILKNSDMKKYFPGVANPRNAAAGTSKRFDGQGCEHLTVLFYDLADHLGIQTEEDKFAYLRKQGFATPWTARGTLKEVIAHYRRYSTETRATLDYEIDGLVVSANSIAAQTLLGEVNRRPRGAIAFKFASQAKVSKVVDILWDTGPSGRVTPVAIVEPVELAGATVQRASLHNMSNVRALGIGVGDEVLVSRRNDVIPYVEEVVEKRGKAAEPPTKCKTCGAGLVTSGEYLLCRNEECPALIEGRILNWIEAIGALEWGDKLIEQLVQAKLVKEPGDLYKLTWQQIANLERRGEKIAKKVLDELRSRLPLTLPVFLAALGIEGFAMQTARLLVSAGYTTIEKLLAATEQDLASIPGLGSIKAGNIVRGLAARKDEIHRLLAQGIVPVTQEQEGPLAGMSFCFTGALSKPRPEMTAFVEKHGGRVLSSVTKELQFLVSGDNDPTSSKAQKAKKYGTKLLDEAAFVQLMTDKGVTLS
ncbi:MAG: NAD-dependent DNA ligase LigA [Polyangiaceae bacterium]|nr:NAD-dependent DNA ligase LigA [Polyangiaceae bacterium]